MDESAINQNRRSRRSNLLMTATLEIAGRSMPVKLRNLSAEGAQIEGQDLPVEGTQLVFRKGEIAAVAQMVWIKDKQGGIRFEDQLAPEAVLHHIPVPRARTKVDFRRPGLASKALTDQERKFAETWIAASQTPPLGD